jgi:hypothetical protein
MANQAGTLADPEYVLKEGVKDMLEDRPARWWAMVLSDWEAAIRDEIVQIGAARRYQPEIVEGSKDPVQLLCFTRSPLTHPCKP